MCPDDDSQHSSANMLEMIRNIAPLPMLRVHLFRYQAVRSPPVSVFTTLLPQSRSGEQRPRCSHCVSRVACRLRVRVVVVEPPTGLLTEFSTGVPWVLTGTHPCDAPPRQVVEHQSASSCCAGRCVVVRRTRSVDYHAVVFCTVSSRKNTSESFSFFTPAVLIERSLHSGNISLCWRP